jgi:hypothetical protein
LVFSAFLGNGGAVEWDCDKPVRLSLPSLSGVSTLFNKLASGYFALSRYKCADAISSFNSLSQGQRETQKPIQGFELFGFFSIFG